MALLSPLFNDATFDGNGDPASGWKLYTYVAGSTTNQATYTDSTGSTPQANPIVLNSRGEPASPIWLSAGASYKFVLKDASDVTVRTVDGVSGINDVTAPTLDQWTPSGLTPTYVSATSFTLSGDQTSAFEIGRRIKTTNSGGTVYSTISASSYGAPNTTVTVVNDSGTLDSGLSAVQLAVLTRTGPSLPRREMFFATKNGTDQTLVPTGTKVTFGTEDSDIGSYFDTTNSRWTPPKGQYVIGGSLLISSGITDQQQYVCYLYKNGATFRQLDVKTASGTLAFVMSGDVPIDQSTASDYYEIFLTLTGGGSVTVGGATTSTFFYGYRLA